VGELRLQGRMRPPGLAAFERRVQEVNPRYSFEQGAVRLSPAFQKTFRSDAEAWSFFRAQPPSYRRVATWWVMSAKKDETRERRLARLIAESAAGRRI
ncbi:MAG: bacteriocin-protection protein, partial [Acidobacteria bacterium]